MFNITADDLRRDHELLEHLTNEAGDLDPHRAGVFNIPNISIPAM